MRVCAQADSGQYLMARELGGKLVVAQADTQAISPDQMKRVSRPSRPWLLSHSSVGGGAIHSERKLGLQSMLNEN